MKNTFVLLSALAACALAATPPVVAQSEAVGQTEAAVIYSQKLYLLQEEKADLDAQVADATAILGLRPDARPAVIRYPLHGSYFDNGRAASYTPQPGYFGRDVLVFGHNEMEFVLELRVLPRFIPVAGFFESTVETVGLYDNVAKVFHLCRELQSFSDPLACKSYSTASFAHQPLIPVAWPDPLGGFDWPALFDPASGELHALVLVPWELVVSETIAIGGGIGSWPVVGDWLGTGERSLGVVGENGAMMLPGVSKGNGWPGQLPVPAGDGLVWPIVLPRSSGADAVALVDPATGDLPWMRLEAIGGASSGVEPCLGEALPGPPLSWSMSPMPDTVAASPEVFFLEVSKEGGIWLVPGLYSESKPQTIPVKFPDDPAGPP